MRAMAPVGPGLAVLVLDLAGGDFLGRDRGVVLRAGVDHRGRELVERPLAEVVVVRVDLTGALGRDENGGVVGDDVLEEAVDARRDHAPSVAGGEAAAGAPHALMRRSPRAPPRRAPRPRPRGG